MKIYTSECIRKRDTFGFEFEKRISISF